MRDFHTRSALRARRGYSALFTVVMLVALCGLVSLGVEVGRVQTARTELRTAADAAGRAAANSFLSTGSITSARQAAGSAASDNTCDGTSVALDTSADVEFGSWNKSSRTFTVLSGAAQNAADAVRITARRTKARGNPISLGFAKVVGMSSCDVSASSIIFFQGGGSGPSGFVGLNGVTFKNNTLVASYNSATNPNPTQFTSYTHGQVASNATIDGGHNTLVLGNVLLGPSGSATGVIATSGTSRQGTALSVPSMPAWTPAANPGGIPQNYSITSDKTLPGGTYYFTSLNIGADLTFSGPATVYVNGNITLDGSLTAYHLLPSNLQIYQLGARSFGDSKSNNVAIVAEITAPNSDFVVKNNLAMYGSAIFNTITTKNNAVLFYDEQAGLSGSKKVISVVR